MSFLAKIKEICRPSYLATLEERVEVVASRRPRLKEMLKPFYESPGSERMDQPEFWDQLLNRVMKTLKREDRVTWFLRKARGTRPAFKAKQSPDPLEPSGVESLLRDIEHYISNAEVNGFEKVLKYQFINQKSDALIDDLKKLTSQSEEEKKETSRLLDRKAEDKTFLKFDDGWEWHLLDRSACADEGKSMRHCGNVPSAKKGQRILSLREPVVKKGKKLWKPHATFIWNADGSLGEMKGFANEKPSEKTHPYIVKLLENPKITRLQGGGYAANKNFKVKDLSQELKENLLAVRPEFEAKKADIDDLVRRIDEYAERQTEYYSSWDFLESYEDILDEHFYQDVQNVDDIPSAFRTLAQTVNVLDPRKFQDNIRACCTFDESDFRDSLASYRPDDIEDHLPDDLAEELANLSEDDQDRVKSRVECHLSGSYVYLDANNSISLNLDEDL